MQYNGKVPYKNWMLASNNFQNFEGKAKKSKGYLENCANFP